MVNLILFVIALLIPIGIANMVPVFVSRIPLLNRFNFPIDFGLMWNGKRLLGANKTWRGLVFGVLSGIVAQILITIFFNNVIESHYLPGSYQSLNPIMLGFLLSFGALFGDAVKSFFKRRLNIAPGKTWLPWDQIDYIVGAILFSYWYLQLPIGIYFVLLVIGFVSHLATVYIGYILKLRDQPI